MTEKKQPEHPENESQEATSENTEHQQTTPQTDSPVPQETDQDELGSSEENDTEKPKLIERLISVFTEIKKKYFQLRSLTWKDGSFYLFGFVLTYALLFLSISLIVWFRIEKIDTAIYSNIMMTIMAVFSAIYFIIWSFQLIRKFKKARYYVLPPVTACILYTSKILANELVHGIVQIASPSNFPYSVNLFSLFMAIMICFMVISLSLGVVALLFLIAFLLKVVFGFIFLEILWRPLFGKPRHDLKISLDVLFRFMKLLTQTYGAYVLFYAFWQLSQPFFSLMDHKHWQERAVVLADFHISSDCDGIQKNDHVAYLPGDMIIIARENLSTHEFTYIKRKCCTCTGEHVVGKKPPKNITRQ